MHPQVRKSRFEGKRDWERGIMTEMLVIYPSSLFNKLYNHKVLRPLLTYSTRTRPQGVTSYLAYCLLSESSLHPDVSPVIH